MPMPEMISADTFRAIQEMKRDEMNVEMAQRFVDAVDPEVLVSFNESAKRAANSFGHRFYVPRPTTPGQEKALKVAAYCMGYDDCHADQEPGFLAFKLREKATSHCCQDE